MKPTLVSIECHKGHFFHSPKLGTNYYIPRVNHPESLAWSKVNLSKENPRRAHDILGMWERQSWETLKVLNHRDKFIESALGLPPLEKNILRERLKLLMIWSRSMTDPHYKKKMDELEPSVYVFPPSSEAELQLFDWPPSKPPLLEEIKSHQVRCLARDTRSSKQRTLVENSIKRLVALI